MLMDVKGQMDQWKRAYNKEIESAWKHITSNQSRMDSDGENDKGWLVSVKVLIAYNNGMIFQKVDGKS